MQYRILFNLMISEWVLGVIQDPILCLGRETTETYVILIHLGLKLKHQDRCIFLLSSCIFEEDLTPLGDMVMEYLARLAGRYRSVRKLRGIRIVTPRVRLSARSLYSHVVTFAVASCSPRAL